MSLFTIIARIRTYFVQTSVYRWRREMHVEAEKEEEQVQMVCLPAHEAGLLEAASVARAAWDASDNAAEEKEEEEMGEEEEEWDRLPLANAIVRKIMEDYGFERQETIERIGGFVKTVIALDDHALVDHIVVHEQDRLFVVLVNIFVALINSGTGPLEIHEMIANSPRGLTIL